MDKRKLSLTSRRPSSCKSYPIISSSQIALQSSRIKIPMRTGQWPINKIQKQVLHLESHRRIEQQFRKFTIRVKEENEFLQRVVNKTSSMVKLSKFTQKTKDIVTKHCADNQALKNIDRIFEEDFITSEKLQQQTRDNFMKKFKQLSMSKREFDRDRVDLVISKSREKYQRSKAGQNKQNINKLVGMFSGFEEYCRNERIDVKNRLSHLEEISASLGKIATKESISVNEFLKHSRLVSRSEIDAHS